MNLQELEKNAADLQAKLDEMKATITKMKAQPSGFWKPAIGDSYYQVGSDGGVFLNHHNGTKTDYAIIEHGNAYRTYEEAKRAREKQEVTRRLRELAGGYRFRRGAANWFVVHDAYDNQWVAANNNAHFNPTTIYFPSKEAALAARDELGPRLDVLLEIE